MFRRPIESVFSFLSLMVSISTHGHLRHGLRRYPGRTLLLIVVLLLPMLFSPTHPIAVYGYLATAYFPRATRPVYADTGGELSSFLVSPSQVAIYRAALLEDMEDEGSGRLFAITRGPDGALFHAPIRTWNAFLPDSLPDTLRRWLDRKEFPFLADEVELWLEGHTLVAMGHYHAFGGGPSRGDRLAQDLSEIPEVVVSNGIIPVLYLRGALLPYGEDVVCTSQLFRSMRSLEGHLTMSVADRTEIPTEATAAMESFLAYLRNYHGVDITDRQAVARDTFMLCEQFKSDYARHFKESFLLNAHSQSPDKIDVIQNLAALRAWATIYAKLPTDAP